MIRTARGADPDRAWRPAAEVFVGLFAVAVFLWGVDTPSPWRDEIDTLAIARREVGQIVALAGRMDLVHLPFYLLSHAVLSIADTLLAVRLISVAAMTAAAVLLVQVGRRLHDVPSGITAGLLLAVAPLASRYAQEARPFALAALTATVATLLLVTALAREEVGRPARSVWIGYAASLVVLDLVNVLAVLLVVGHAGFVLTRARTGWRRWLIASAAAGLTVSGQLILAFGQRAQLAWATRPQLYDLRALYVMAFGSKLFAVLIASGSIAVAVLAFRRGGRRVGATVATLPPTLVLGASWALLPPATLWFVSQATSFWNLRYVVVCLPGLALWTGALPGALWSSARPGRIRHGTLGEGRRVAVAVVLVLAAAVVGLPAQRAWRDPRAGHDEDLRGAVQYLAAQAGPGDAVLYAPSKLRAIETELTGAARDLADLALDVDPLTAATLAGVEVSPADLDRRLATTRRVWLVHSEAIGPSVITTTDAVKMDLSRRGFVRVAHRAFVSVSVDLYQQ